MWPYDIIFQLFLAGLWGGLLSDQGIFQTCRGFDPIPNSKYPVTN